MVILGSVFDPPLTQWIKLEGNISKDLSIGSIELHSALSSFLSYDGIQWLKLGCLKVIGADPWGALQK